MANETVAGGMSPEVELLLCCARTSVDAANAKRIKVLLGKDIDWAYLVRTARRHGTTPLLYRSLASTSPESVPEATLNQLRDHCNANASRNLALATELHKVLRLFESHGIPAISFKGPELAVSVYGSLDLREFGDLDLIIHRQDFLRAKELLISEGYRRGYRPRTRAQELADFRFRYHRAFVRDDADLEIELHWAVVERHFSFPLDPEQLWEHLTPVSLAGTTVLTLAPQTLLLVFCVHGAKHFWKKLTWLCDVAELIRTHQAMDWAGLIEQAAALRVQRLLYLALFLSGDLLGAPIPQEVFQKVQEDAVVRSLGPQVREWVVSSSNNDPGFLQRVRFRFRARECLQDRVRHTWYRLRQLANV